MRRRVVDATYLSPTIPATTPPPFGVADDARVVAINALARLTAAPNSYVIVGSGKTATDGIVWLLANGVQPDRIVWVRPRDPWMLNRAVVQPDPAVALGLAADTMAAAGDAESLDDLFLRLEAAGVMLRVDRDVLPTMAKTPTLGAWELDLLRTIEHVVRLGHIKHVTRRHVVLDEGSLPLAPGSLVVHCAASGLQYPPLVPVWGQDKLRLQTIRVGFPCFSAALAGYVEATRDDDRERNRLCPPNTLPDGPTSWARMQVRGTVAARTYSAEPDIAGWANGCALNPARRIPLRASASLFVGRVGEIVRCMRKAEYVARLVEARQRSRTEGFRSVGVEARSDLGIDHNGSWFGDPDQTSGAVHCRAEQIALTGEYLSRGEADFDRWKVLVLCHSLRDAARDQRRVICGARNEHCFVADQLHEPRAGHREFVQHDVLEGADELVECCGRKFLGARRETGEVREADDGEDRARLARRELPQREAPTSLREMSAVDRFDHRVQARHQVGGKRHEPSRDVEIIPASGSQRRFDTGAQCADRCIGHTRQRRASGTGDLQRGVATEQVGEHREQREHVLVGFAAHERLDSRVGEAERAPQVLRELRVGAHARRHLAQGGALGSREDDAFTGKRVEPILCQRERDLIHAGTMVQSQRQQY